MSFNIIIACCSVSENIDKDTWNCDNVTSMCTGRSPPVTKTGNVTVRFLLGNESIDRFFTYLDDPVISKVFPLRIPMRPLVHQENTFVIGGNTITVQGNVL